MSDVMSPIPFAQLMTWALDEYKAQGTVFGCRKVVRHTTGEARPIFDERIEAPFGPAAGPNTQLAQNIIAAYVTGARFFELKTVQKMDGAELSACVNKPCILASDEGYNCEWSTELTVPQAYAEYVKAWVACKLLSRELGLGEPDGFVFNMSVGYDLEGIKTPKVDGFINKMMDASQQPEFQEAIAWAKANLARFDHVDEAFVDAIPARVSNSITESTLHGCPPDEIERIATHLICEKGLNTYIKCNPTLLGYRTARDLLDSLGFDYVAFDEHHFLEDLQWADAVPMFQRLQALCDERGLEFGVKLTNTFPVDVTRSELPSQEMYMSGRSLYPLSLTLADRIAHQFDGKLRISYSGGADAENIRGLVDAGIWPVTMATNILKPGGYDRMAQVTEALAGIDSNRFGGVDPKATAALVAAIPGAKALRHSLKPVPNRHVGEKLPLLDCFTAPCSEDCPIHQDIPGYLRAHNEGRDADALGIILEKNALPFMTGTLCPHTCGNSCMRNYYEDHVLIREAKLAAAKGAYDQVLPTLAARGTSQKRVAVVGAGPAGLATAAFLSRQGASVTVLERTDRAGGVPRHVIPGFRISDEAIEHDVALACAYGAKVEYGREVSDVRDLLAQGYTDVVVAVGAWAKGASVLAGQDLDALEFLRQFKANPASCQLGTDVVVVGGGNTAMDVARASKRVPGVKNVRLAYRRDRHNMPADEEELAEALAEGVELCELLSPASLADGVLTCDVMRLGEPDGSGRRRPEPTGEKRQLPATAVIAAVGERVEQGLFVASGIEVDRKGRPVVDEELQTSVPHVYAAGDARRGPATIVKAEADAQVVAKAILGPATSFEGAAAANVSDDYEGVLDKRAILAEADALVAGSRCLGCPTVCETCVEVCPNRANVAIRVPGMRERQIVHVDGMCNECGNCAVFCPYEEGRPYKDKLTLFWTRDDVEASDNDGFLATDDGFLVRLDGAAKVYDVDDEACGLPEGVRRTIVAVRDNYPYLLCR